MEAYNIRFNPMRYDWRFTTAVITYHCSAPRYSNQTPTYFIPYLQHLENYESLCNAPELFNIKFSILIQTLT